MRFLEDRTISNFVNLFLRLLQLVAALVVIALYGVDLHSAHVEKKYSDSKWVCDASGLAVLRANPRWPIPAPPRAVHPVFPGCLFPIPTPTIKLNMG